MQDDLPLILKKSWKDRLLSYRTQYLQDKILTCQTKLISAVKKPDSALYRRLNDSFWKNLSSSSLHKETIQECYQTWKKIEPLAHLNVKDLVSLLTKDIIPLEPFMMVYFCALVRTNG
jgi:hypothetical protein